MNEPTKRQKSIIKLVTKGFSNKQIATDLGLAENTVKVYMSQIFDKLDLDNRHQVANYGRSGESKFETLIALLSESELTGDEWRRVLVMVLSRSSGLEYSVEGDTQ